MMRENFRFISKAEFQCVLGFNFRILVSGIFPSSSGMQSFSEITISLRKFRWSKVSFLTM